MRALILLAILASSHRMVAGRAILDNNGYTDLVVAISPDVDESSDLLANLQSLLTEASARLYRATRSRAYFRRVKILLPPSWTSMDNTVPVVAEAFDTADIRLDEASPLHGDTPYTVQGGGCGEPGQFLHITPWFVDNHNGSAVDMFGDTGKAVVHEWAKLRWGVYEEHGYPGDEKFPMYYYKTSWTAAGQTNVITPNFCTETDLSGYGVDMSSGGDCSYNASTNLPDHQCYFQATEDNVATSSFMSIPFLDSVDDFCDDTEEHYHDPDLPNRHNLYCQGRSVWNVISASEDFANGVNPSNPGQDTVPEFVLVRPEDRSVRYVLVMDRSLSMLPSANDDEVHRGRNMKDAAKRWIKYDIDEGVNLGMVVFSDETYVRPLMNLTEIDNNNRDLMLETVDNITFDGQTCIGCGLAMAMNYSGLLGGKDGGVIILITDGKQQCRNPGSDACIQISNVTGQIVERGIKVVTIALGLEADEEIEDLAQMTGGKSYFVDDSSGPGDINDAFTGSLTYQPGDILGKGNTTTTLYQRDFIFKNCTLNCTVLPYFNDYFEVDDTIGKDLIFQLDVRTVEGDYNCTEDLSVDFYTPTSDYNSGFIFRCNDSNFGVIQHQLPDLMTGHWKFTINKTEVYESFSVKITSKSKNDGTSPIYSRCWISTGGQKHNGTAVVTLAVMAEVMQGNNPVIGAVVRGYVERPSTENQTYPPLDVELFDNGAGADGVKNDGIYGRYFTQYTGKGRYSVKCQVTGTADTQINGGFISNRKTRGARMYPANVPGTPMCCGSDAVMPETVLNPSGVFQRQAAGGSFQVTTEVDPNFDNIAPGRVLDLAIVDMNQEDKFITVKFTSPGGDLDSPEPPAQYIIKFTDGTAGNITGDNFDTNPNNTQVDPTMLRPGSSLEPVSGGSTVSLEVAYEGVLAPDTKYTFAMKAVDTSDNAGPVSNLAVMVIKTELDDLPGPSSVSTTPASTPVSTTPASTTPVSSTPTSSTPASTTPVSTTPVSTTPVSSTPASTTPVSSTPASTTPSVSTRSTYSAVLTYLVPLAMTITINMCLF